MDEKRLVDIETRIAFQEHTIKELSDVIYQQQQQMEKLDRTCSTLVKRVKELLEFGQGLEAPANEKPPHY